MSIPNSIEREIRIDAPVERVWALVSEPGWWVNEGTVRPHRLEERAGLTIVHDETHGEFAFETLISEPHERIVFRWHPTGGATDGHIVPTVVTFTLRESAGHVVLRVVEAGFAEGDAPEEVRKDAYDGNTEGWEIELAAARAHLESPLTRR
jgi:uncharacterized protein YndB with AHSA1/START domain